MTTLVVVPGQPGRLRAVDLELGQVDVRHPGHLGAQQGEPHPADGSRPCRYAGETELRWPTFALPKVPVADGQPGDPVDRGLDPVAAQRRRPARHRRCSTG